MTFSDADRAAEAREMDDWYRTRPFRWMFPKFLAYRPADERPRFVLNRYPHNIIGAGIVLFGKCWSVRWKRTRITHNPAQDSGLVSARRVLSVPTSRED